MATDARALLQARSEKRPAPAHVDLDECWLWTGPITKDYPSVSFRGRTWRGNRLSYETFIGPIPDGLMVCHRCDVRACVNPGHLFIGTRQQNMDDMVNKGRSTAGTKHPGVRLTDDQVIEIRRLHANGAKQVDLAATYGIHKAQTSSIIRGDKWKHLLPADFVAPPRGRWARGA